MQTLNFPRSHSSTCKMTKVAQELDFPFQISDVSLQHRCPSERDEDSIPYTEYLIHG